MPHRIVKTKLQIGESSCVGIFKKPGEPVGHGNYFGALPLCEKEEYEKAVAEKGKLFGYLSSSYKALNMWAENFAALETDLGITDELEVILFTDPVADVKSFFVVDERVPESYRINRNGTLSLFHGYVGRSEEHKKEISEITGLNWES